MAMILDPFVGEFVEWLAAFVEEEVSSVLGVKGELKNLQKTLENIKVVLQDDERRRIQDKGVKKWLKDLKDVMYDADDILDLCGCKGGILLQDDDTPSSSASPVFCYSPLLSCFTSLNDRLEKFMFELEPPKPDDMIRGLGGVNPRQTFPVEEDVVGSDIKEATDRLVELKQADRNSVSPSNSVLQVVSQVPEEGAAEREETSTTAALTGAEDSATTAELEEATKFSYFATALAGGGIVSLLIFHLEKKSAEPHTLVFKALTFFILATFAFGLSITLLTICAPSASYQMPIIRGLVYATIGFLALSGVSVCIALMKAMGSLVFVLVIVVVIVPCIIVYYKKTVRSGQYLPRWWNE